MRTLIAVALVLLVLGLSAPARADCAAIERALAGVASDVHCVASADLTTRNADTTPPDNSHPGLPPNAFTPRTDAQAVSPDAPFRTPIRSEEHTSELQSLAYLVCRLLLEKKKKRYSPASDRSSRELYGCAREL